MVDHSSRTKKKKQADETPSASSGFSSSFSYTSSDDVEASSKRHKRSQRRHRDEKRWRDGSSRREEEKRRRERRKKRKREQERKRRRDSRRRSRREGKRKGSSSESDGGSESASDDDASSPFGPEDVVREILKEFPGVAGDLEQLLHMIDDGQAVDISGLSERFLIKLLKKLFQSLNLKESGNLVYLLPPQVRPKLDVVLPIIRSHIQSEQHQLDHTVQTEDVHSVPIDVEQGEMVNTAAASVYPEEDVGPRRRMIGPEMPSAELLAAAAKLTEAEAELREVELDEDTGVFIGPPPPAVVTEAESANEAERFEEVTRIMGVEVDNPYDVVGVNRNMSADNIKKRYWKLSLMVHPDKCPHPEAHQAFIKLNKAFKDLQDPDKRKALDDKIKAKEEQEEFKAELKAMREAAQWRRLQGISMEGDDLLLADMDVKVERKRDEWMTTLPPERKPGMTMQTTKFSRNSKDGRGDTSVWTDTPSERAQKAKMDYLEAYNEAAALAPKEKEKKRSNADAELVDEYNKVKRSKSLVEKHKEAAKNSKRKSKQEPAKEEWEGKHPWKPWDREKDLTAGRQSVKLDTENMVQGLSSRFSSGSFQRNFL
ncbi:hypothetical protein NMG60_11035763 [Bertholletia excelsa]